MIQKLNKNNEIQSNNPNMKVSIIALENSHSTISERSSEENEDHFIADIMENVLEDDDNDILNSISLKEIEDIGEIDLEYSFLNKNDISINFNPCLRKTSFFYLKNNETMEKSKKMSSFGENTTEKDVANRKSNIKNRLSIVSSRRNSQMVYSKRDSKSDRMESLAKIQSDIINRMYKKSEMSYNFIVKGHKYLVIFIFKRYYIDLLVC